MGRDDFTKIPNGIPSFEDRVNLLYTYGVKTGRLDLHTFVKIASTNAAKIFGLFPRKGTIQPGSDADLVIYDPTYRGKISAATHLMNVDYNAFEGWQIEGRPSSSPCAAKWLCATESSSAPSDAGVFYSGLSCKNGPTSIEAMAAWSAANLSSRTARLRKFLEEANSFAL